MSDPVCRRKAWQPYFRMLADVMGLKDWTVEIDDEPPVNQEAYAVARCSEGRKYIIVDLARGFLDADPKTQRMIAVHELLHAHFSHMDFCIEKMISQDQNKVHRINLELTVDAVAVAWAEMLPMPPEAQ